MRRIYLEDLPLKEAWSRFRSALEPLKLWQPLGNEAVALDQANGRITAKPLWARISSPHYHASAMDGYAVRAADTVGATETTPLNLQLTAPDRPGAATAVNTGQPLPDWADAVIMIEQTRRNNEQTITIFAAVTPWSHVRLMGEDMVATELVLPANQRIRPFDIGAAAGAGHHQITVYRQPRVAILPTGSELVDPARDKPLAPGEIIEYNSLMLAAQVANWGGKATRLTAVADEIDALKTAVLTAIETTDLLLINAGSSAGSKDYTAQIVADLGKLLVHGVAVRPGHPVILGLLTRQDGSAIPVIGVPGYPVSAALTGELFIKPLLQLWQGASPQQSETIQAQLTRKLNSPTGDDDYVRVVTAKVRDTQLAAPISRGAGVISSLVQADGLLLVPRFSEGINQGESVTVQLLRPRAELVDALLFSGSHDLTIDLLTRFLAENMPPQRLSAAATGSLGGLIALRRGVAHVAGTHLLDPETGTFNDSYIRRYLPKTAVVVITVAQRQQGWIVPQGNPRALQDWSALARQELRLINRQRGAGTRLLLDYQLKENGLTADKISGYDQEAYTHLAVAAAVASGSADYGLGICAAAQALNLAFVPLTTEPYELVIPLDIFQSGVMDRMLALFADGRLEKAVALLPGYDPAGMGQQRILD